MEEEKIINGSCWVAYFDILGFKKLVEEETKSSGLEIFVQTDYLKILKELEEKRQYYPSDIVYTWASDSFVLFTLKDDSVHFGHLLKSAGHFFTCLIQDKLPVRGAISYGEFYADTDKYIFVGPALIDAYEYAEKLEILGFVLTPLARKRLNNIETRYSGKGGDLREYNVPVKPVGTTESLWAYTFGQHPYTLQSMEEMKKQAVSRSCEENVTRKYDNTLAFLKATGAIKC